MPETNNIDARHPELVSASHSHWYSARLFSGDAILTRQLDNDCLTAVATCFIRPEFLEKI